MAQDEIPEVDNFFVPPPIKKKKQRFTAGLLKLITDIYLSTIIVKDCVRLGILLFV